MTYTVKSKSASLCLRCRVALAMHETHVSDAAGTPKYAATASTPSTHTISDTSANVTSEDNGGGHPSVGDAVGCADGDSVGVVDGACDVGASVGSGVGVIVGDSVGVAVGEDVVSDAVGDAVGADVVGESVGDNVGDDVVGDSVGD